jgi:hypothetical protein
MTAPSSSSTFVFDATIAKQIDDLAKNNRIATPELLRRALALYSVAQSLSGATGHIVLENPTTGSKLDVTL